MFLISSYNDDILLDNNDRYTGRCAQHVPYLSFSHSGLCRSSSLGILIVALIENESRLVVG